LQRHCLANGLLLPRPAGHPNLLATASPWAEIAYSWPLRNFALLDGGESAGFIPCRSSSASSSFCGSISSARGWCWPITFITSEGTSTGAIIAGMLSWGRSVDEVIDLYHTQAKLIFGNRNLRLIYRSKFGARAICASCAMRPPAPVGSLPIPAARSSTPARTRSANLDIPLYQLIRASTAAPFYFPPEDISAGAQEWVFLDGALTHYNTPASSCILPPRCLVYGEPWRMARQICGSSP